VFACYFELGILFSLLGDPVFFITYSFRVIPSKHFFKQLAVTQGPVQTADVRIHINFQIAAHLEDKLPIQALVIGCFTFTSAELAVTG